MCNHEKKIINEKVNLKMKTTRQNSYQIFILLFVLLNILNTYFLTTSVLNKYIAPFSHTFMGELTSIIGNASVLLGIVFMITLIFKSLRLRMISLIIMTFLLNFFVFILGVFNLYYGTAFSFEMLNLFNNPTGGFAGQTAIEAFKELIVYYRILVFLPFFALITWFVVTRHHTKKLIYKRNYKILVIQILATFVMVLATSLTYTKQLMKDMPIQSAVPSYAVQNLGVYPYYLQDALGLNTTINYEQVLSIEEDQDMLDLLQTYNKNVNQYTNIIDGLTYSNRLTEDQAVYDYLDPNLMNDTSLHGIFEGKNLVLIHLESFNYFLLQNQSTNEQMSFLNNLLSESYVLTNYYASVGMGVSSDAELAVLTGLNPQGDKTLYWDYNHMAYDLPSIPQYLSEDNYYTEAIHGDIETFYNRHVVYPNLYHFNTSYTLENFIENGYNVDAGYVYDTIENTAHISPWVSDYYLADYTAQLGQSLSSNFMLYPIYMMGHTPFDFGPYGNASTIYPNYAEQVQNITLKYINYANYYSETIKRFFIAENGTDQTIDQTVYIFYSDHGSGLKNGDLDILFDRQLDDMEERQILQHTLAFIYAPSQDEYVDFGDYQIRKGMLVGEQNLVRSPIDLYRSIVELFNIPIGNDAYFGVNVLSSEPTFVLDNRILDIVTDEVFYSMRNVKQKYPSNQSINESLHSYIMTYKMFSDYLLSTETKLKELNERLND